MGLDDRLGALRAAESERPGVGNPDGALAAVHSTVRRRHRRRRALGASIAAVLVLVAVGVALASRGGEEGQRVVTSPTEDGAPPSIDRSTPHLWLSAEELPPEGGDVAVVIVDPTGTGDTWGVAATVEQWNGTAWKPYDDAKVCLDAWACSGQIGGVEAVEDIGLGASPAGPLTWFRVEDLDAGWYRLAQTSNEGTVAAGQFEVTADAPAPPPSGRGAPVHLRIEPALVYPGLPPRVDPQALPPATPSTVPGNPEPEPMTELAVRGQAITGSVPHAWQDARSRIERWDGQRWVDASAVVEGGASIGVGPDDPNFLEVPEIVPGAYRVIVTMDGGETLEGRFWMTDQE